MKKYMTHPERGGEFVFMDDFERKQKEGWVFSEEPKEEKMVPIGMAAHLVNAIGIEPEESPIDRYEKKFGKPPHHRMKPESIIAALKE